MTVPEITELCRKAASSAEIAHAQRVVQAALDELRKTLAAAQADWPRILAEEPDQVAERAETRTRSLQRDHQRLQVLLSALATRLAEAQASELRAGLLASEAALNAKCQALVQEFRRDYPEPARKIAAWLRKEGAWLAEYEEHKRLIRAAMGDGLPNDGGTLHTPAQMLAGAYAVGDTGQISIGAAVRLPNEKACPQVVGDRVVFAGEEPAIWWPPAPPRRLA